MASARRDDILRQIRALPVEDREFIAAALMDATYEQTRPTLSSDELAEVVQRATDAVVNPDRGFSREESLTRAKGAVDAVHLRKP